MPDQFGFATPEEQLALQTEQMRERALINSRSPSAGVQVGQSLANIFAPAINRRLGNPAVSRAEALNNITSNAGQVMEDLVSEGVSPDKARATAMLSTARKLRRAGFKNEASILSQQAGELAQKAEVDALNLRKLKADVAQEEFEVDSLGAPEPPQDAIIRLQDERDSLVAQLQQNPENGTIARRLAELQAKIDKDITLVGRTETDAEALGLAQPTINDLESSLLESGNVLLGLEAAGAGFNPAFLTIPGQLTAGLTNLAEKLTLPVPDEQKRFAIEYAAFAADSMDGLSRYIKEITGAQMSELEAERLRKGFPDVERDGPSKFLAKYNATVARLQAVRRRAQFALETGDLDTIDTAPIEDFIIGEADVDTLENQINGGGQLLSPEENAALDQLLAPAQ